MIVFKYSLIIVLFSFCNWVTAQTNRIEIPITIHDGLGKGIGEYSMNGLSFVDWDTYIWKDIITSPRGVPNDWTEIRLGVEFLNQPQFIYQHTKSGHIKEGYMLASWLENAQFTETPIRCYFLFAEGIDTKGKRRFVVDQNNNGDLSDDTFFCADSITFEQGRKELRIAFDAYINGEVVPQERTFYIGYNPDYQMYLGKVAEYATCELNGTSYMLSPYGHNYMVYEDFEAIPFEIDQAYIVEQSVRRGEYIWIEDNWYCFKGMDVSRQIAILEKEERSQSEILAMQTGFKPYPFSGIEFISKDSLYLSQYNGKTLLLMVWSPGCGLCIEKIPPMNEMYALIDLGKVALLGLAIHTNAEYLTSVKEEHAISFPLMIGEHGQLHDAYFRLITPTFFLINPEGVITMKTLNFDEVKEEVNGLLIVN